MRLLTWSSGPMRARKRETEGRTEGEKKKAGLAVFFFNGFLFCYLSVTDVKLCNISLIHYPVQYIRGQYCTFTSRVHPDTAWRGPSVLNFVLRVDTNPVMRWDCDQRKDWLGLHLLSQFELVGNFAGDVLKGDGRARYPLEAHAVERKAGQLAHLHLPLDQIVLASVAVDTEKQEALALLVVAAVGVQDFSDLPHHLRGLHGGGGLHAPGETQGARLWIPTAVLLSVTRRTPEQETIRERVRAGTGEVGRGGFHVLCELDISQILTLVFLSWHWPLPH